MSDRREKILDVAASLAEEGGFENVRQRDVAARAGVALGTLYKSFRSKQDILSAALERETEMLERRVEETPVPGDTPRARLTGLFDLLIELMCSKPNYTQAVIRAVVSGEPEVARNVASYNVRMTQLVIASMRGLGRVDFTDPACAGATEGELTISQLMQHIWFSTLVGWSAGLIDRAEMRGHLHTAIELMLRGTEAGEAREAGEAGEARSLGR